MNIISNILILFYRSDLIFSICLIQSNIVVVTYFITQRLNCIKVARCAVLYVLVVHYSFPTGSCRVLRCIAERQIQFYRNLNVTHLDIFSFPEKYICSYFH